MVLISLSIGLCVVESNCQIKRSMLTTYKCYTYSLTHILLSKCFLSIPVMLTGKMYIKEWSKAFLFFIFYSTISLCVFYLLGAMTRSSNSNGNVCFLSLTYMAMAPSCKGTGNRKRLALLLCICSFVLCPLADSVFFSSSLRPAYLILLTVKIFRSIYKINLYIHNRKSRKSVH